MSILHYKKRSAWIESVSLSQIAASVSTPFYVYSRAGYLKSAEAFLKAFQKYPSLTCYAVKANSNLSILKDLCAAGLGADIVSLGELKRAKLAGYASQNIVFSGVGKQSEEIAEALKENILLFNVESASELQHINAIAKEMGKVAPISLRVNPNIDAKTNPYIATGLYKTKFGIPETQLLKIIALLRPLTNLKLCGLSMHLGSQITSKKPFTDGAKRMAKLAVQLQKMGLPLGYLNLGGGLGIDYEGKTVLDIESYAKTILTEIKPTNLKLILEPGRAIIGSAGALVTKVLHIKTSGKKTFVIVDAGMNDLIRPSLYGAFHRIKTSPLRTTACNADIVGPICETGDFFALNRKITKVHPGDLVVVLDAGAYGMSMASHYNSRPNLAEILVESDSYRVIRRAEPLEAQWANELSFI